MNNQYQSLSDKQLGEALCNLMSMARDVYPIVIHKETFDANHASLLGEVRRRRLYPLVSGELTYDEARLFTQVLPFTVNDRVLSIHTGHAGHVASIIYSDQREPCCHVRWAGRGGSYRPALGLVKL